MPRATKVIVIGLDGLEPTIVEGMLQAGELPHLARLRASGGYARLGTTLPAQTPVAWSTFATGTNPGGHGIFDFLRRDPATYLPDLALARHEQPNAFLPPRAVNLRGGETIWGLLTRAGIPSAVLRCPCTYPPDSLKGRMLAGMGVPDLRGGIGTATFYSSAPEAEARESEQLVRLEGTGPVYRSWLIGPRASQSSSARGGDHKLDMALEVDAGGRSAVLRSSGSPATLALRVGEWSDWLRVKFRAGFLASSAGMMRFLLCRADAPVELYASPVNFDPAAPLYPISHPWDYAGELDKRVGPFYTAGMVEDHAGLTNGRFGETEFLAQCEGVVREREAMMRYELDRLEEGFLFCLFDTPDRLQHMFWRFREPEHPANVIHGLPNEYLNAIADHYRRCDGIVGEALGAVDADTLFIVLSDHGFASFQRGVHLNAWLQREGFLVLERGVEPGAEAGDFLRHADWSRTRAYALGLGSIYLNLRGREGAGIVEPSHVQQLSEQITSGLARLLDEERGQPAVRGVARASEVYQGPFTPHAPDLVVKFAAGYRVSWATALGGVPAGIFEDNERKWGGDHIVDPELVPGVVFMNRTFRGDGAHIADLAPTILAALGAPRGEAMEGRNLLAGTGA